MRARTRQQYNTMANSNSGHMSHNDYNENFFPSSHDFGGLDAVLQNPEELSFEQGWGYQSEPMSVDQVATPNFQWQSAIQQHNSSSDGRPIKHHDLYPRSFSTTPTGFHDAPSANVDGFNTYQQSQYELATLPISTTTGEHHKSHNALFPSAGAQATTIAPEALQNITAPYTNTSGASQYQVRAPRHNHRLNLEFKAEHIRRRYPRADLPTSTCIRRFHKV